MKVYIKNMACECCKAFVQDELEKLDLDVQSIDIGEATLQEKISKEKLDKFNSAIKRAGLELIESKEGLLLEKIKKAIIDYVDNSKEKPGINLSVFLNKELHLDYAYLSRFFSEIEATTIEQYLISLKIDKVKELLVLNDYTLTEIADRLYYSSVAHLSAQFKKMTGLTPSHFKKLRKERGLVSPEFLKKEHK
ncbi:MAG TPA: helix-turn-helix domain-containing protein [Ferruginibacter sp.]|nr:helix-turn-helix domain-containing protein [Ferruginibacter sp.]